MLLAGGEDVGVEGAGSRLGEHIGYRRGPRVVVGGLPVFFNVTRVAVDLQQHESRGVIGLLDEVKADHSRLPYAIGCVFYGGRFKRFDMLGLDANMDVHDVLHIGALLHITVPPSSTTRPPAASPPPSSRS